jgi:transposase
LRGTLVNIEEIERTRQRWSARSERYSEAAEAIGRMLDELDRLNARIAELEAEAREIDRANLALRADAWLAETRAIINGGDADE